MGAAHREMMSVALIGIARSGVGSYPVERKGLDYNAAEVYIALGPDDK